MSMHLAGTNNGGVQPVSTGSTRHDGHFAHADAASSLPFYKRLWGDPLWFRWITTFVWSLGVGVTFGVVGDFSLFNIFLGREFNSTVAELSWLGALPWCLFCVFSPLADFFVRMFGYRATLGCSSLLSAVGLGVTSFIHALWPAFISYSVLVGGGSVVLYTAGCVYVTQFFDKRHCTGPVSTGGVMFEVAILIYSPIIDVTANAWGWRWCLRLLASIALAVTGLLFIFIRTPPRHLFVELDDDAKGYEEKDTGDVKKEREKLRESDETNDGLNEEEEEEGDEESSVPDKELSCLRRYQELYRRPAFWLFLAGVISSFTALSFIHINLGQYLTSEGVSDQQTAMMHSLLAGGALLGRLGVLFIHLLPISIVFTYPIIAILAAVGTVTVRVVTKQWMFYVYSFLMGLLRGLYFSLSTGIAVELSGKSIAAEAYASTFVSWGIGSALAVIVPGVTHRLTGSYWLAMVTGAALWGASALFYTAMCALHLRGRSRARGTSQSGHRRLPLTDPDAGDFKMKRCRVDCDVHSNAVRVKAV